MMLFNFCTAITATLVASCWIDSLYSKPEAPVSCQEKFKGSYARKIFLASIYFFAGMHCVKMPPMDWLYHVTAAFFLGIIVVTDFEQYIIFDIVLLPFAFAGFLFSLAFDLNLVERLLAGICGGMVFFFLLLLTKNGIGGGDVKLIATLGLWLGFEGLFETVMTAAILGGICALLMIASGVKRLNDYFAYGPYFCIAAAWQLFH